MTQIVNTNSGTDFSSLYASILTDTNGNYVTITASGIGAGDVSGPASSTTNAVAVYAGTTGKVLKNSTLIYSANTLSSVPSLAITSSGTVSVNSSTDDVNVNATNVNIAAVNHLDASGFDFRIHATTGTDFVAVSGNSASNELVLTQVVGGAQNSDLILNGTNAILDWSSISGYGKITLAADSAHVETAGPGGSAYVNQDNGTVQISGSNQTVLTGGSTSPTQIVMNDSNIDNITDSFRITNHSGSDITQISNTQTNMGGYSTTNATAYTDVSFDKQQFNVYGYDETAFNNFSLLQSNTGVFAAYGWDAANAYSINRMNLSDTNFNLNLYPVGSGIIFTALNIQPTSFASFGRNYANGNTYYLINANDTSTQIGGYNSTDSASVTRLSMQDSNISMYDYVQGSGAQQVFSLDRNSGFVNTDIFSIGGDLLPYDGPGVGSIGWQNIPFSGVFANQYGTTFVETSGTNLTVDWNAGSTQRLNFSTTPSGTYTIGFVGGLPGSAYVLTTKQNNTGTISINWSGSQVAWQGGVSGTMTAASGTTDLMSFVCDASNHYLGSFSNNYF